MQTSHNFGVAPTRTWLVGAVALAALAAGIFLLHAPRTDAAPTSSTLVSTNELVEIAVRFTTYSGRYMYHCHILEHEDRDMMRPFVTMAPELMPFMA